MWRAGALNLCLVCLKTENLEEYKKDNEIFTKLKFVTDKEISDLLPTSLCNKCVKRLKIAYDFKFQCLLSQKHLNSFFQKITQDFQKSMPQAVFDDDDCDLNQFEVIETKKDQKVERMMMVQEASTSESQNDQSEPYQSKELQKKSDSESENENMKILDYNIVTETEPTEIYQQDTEEIYDILEIENSEDENIAHLTIDKDSSMEMEENQLIYLNIKPESEGQFKLIATNSEIDEKVETSLNNPPKKRKIFKLEEDAKVFAKSAGDIHLCTKCNRSFSTRTNLYRHLQAHDGAKNYICDVCNKGFTQSGSLKQHYFIHTGERPFKCSYCDKAFTQGKSLKFHLRRHTNEKPYDCSVCGTKFRQKDGLKRHIKSRHPEADIADKDLKIVQLENVLNS